MKNFKVALGLGFGVTLAAGIIYSVSVSVAMQLIVMFILGAVVFGGVILGTAWVINSQWTRALAGGRTTHNIRYDAPAISGQGGGHYLQQQQPYVIDHQSLLPPLTLPMEEDNGEPIA